MFLHELMYLKSLKQQFTFNKLTNEIKHATIFVQITNVDKHNMIYTDI